MKDVNRIVCEYNKIDFNKNVNLVHSIDIEDYISQCIKLFAKKSNTDYFLYSVNNNINIENESEIAFINWLKME